MDVTDEKTDSGTAGGKPVGYSVILPPGWVGIPLRDGEATESAIRKIVDDACRDLPSSFPRDKRTPYRLELERRLRRGTDQARKGSGLDLYMPVYRRGGTPLGASFVVAELTVSHPDATPADLLGSTADGSDSTDLASVEVADCPAIRRDSLVRGGTQEDAELGSRRIDYVIPVPRDPMRWVVVSFSTVGAGDPEDEIAEATTELFDAIMTTFRWRTT